MARLLTPIAIACSLLVLAPARDAWAYLDPGTGSFIIQIVVASALGALFTIKLWLRHARVFFKRVFGAKTPAPAAAGATGTPPALAAKDETGPADQP